MVRSFIQRAVGEFCCRVKPGTPHCGPGDDGKFTFQYEIKIHYDRNSLDINGFLLDNTSFRDYFQAFECCRIAVSCENLACTIAKQFYEMKPQHIQRIEVSLSPVGGVFVECDFVRDDLAIPATLQPAQYAEGAFTPQRASF